VVQPGRGCPWRSVASAGRDGYPSWRARHAFVRQFERQSLGTDDIRAMTPPDHHQRGAAGYNGEDDLGREPHGHRAAADSRPARCRGVRPRGWPRVSGRASQRENRVGDARLLSGRSPSSWAISGSASGCSSDERQGPLGGEERDCPCRSPARGVAGRWNIPASHRGSARTVASHWEARTRGCSRPPHTGLTRRRRRDRHRRSAVTKRLSSRIIMVQSRPRNRLLATGSCDCWGEGAWARSMKRRIGRSAAAWPSN
jgi:hypothetical protein